MKFNKCYCHEQGWGWDGLKGGVGRATRNAKVQREEIN